MFGHLFILVTKTNDDSVHKLESELKKIIKKYDLRDNFIYVVYDNNIKEINDKLGSKISRVPAIIYYRNGEFIKSIDNNLSGGEFQKLLDEYEVK